MSRTRPVPSAPGRREAGATATVPPAASHSSTSDRRRRWSRRALAATAVVALPLGFASAAMAESAVVKTNPGGLTTAGPVNAEYGFPAWYQDKGGQRVELC